MSAAPIIRRDLYRPEIVRSLRRLREYRAMEKRGKFPRHRSSRIILNEQMFLWHFRYATIAARSLPDFHRAYSITIRNAMLRRNITPSVRA